MNKKRILIVDDEPDVLTLTAITLEKRGYDTITAVNGNEAMEIIKEDEPDLLLVDLIMPVVYGAELCRQLKNDEKLKHIPIILFTAHCDIMTAETAKNLKADDYVTKPFDTQELITKIDKLLAERVIS